MLTSEDLLGHGYLPKQLPPPFFSTEWADAVKKYSIKPPNKHPETTMLKVSVPRPNGLPRILGIPHPAHFHTLAELVSTNWLNLISICKGSKISLSTPRLGDRSKGERALEAQDGFPQFAQIALDRRAGRRFMLKADVSQCYPSTYTHAISWAIQGKAAAKFAYKSIGAVPHFADLIDKAVREGQEKQSIGIPIGPDTSFLLANVLLSRVDEMLQNEIKDIAGVRLLDDYELYFDTVAEAEAARTKLAHALATFNLMLNPTKTKVIDLPNAIEPEWKHRLSELDLRGNASRVTKKLRTAADYAFGKRHDDIGSRAITYLLTILSSCVFQPDVWPVAQSVALASLHFEENSLPRAAKMFVTALGKGWKIDTSGISELLNRIIIRSSLLRHGQAVAWATWMMIVLDLKISRDAVEAMTNAEDPVALIVLAHGREKGSVNGFKINALAKALSITNFWDGPHWMFLYECVQHDWLGQATKKLVETSLKKQPYLAVLNKRNVSFYDVSSGVIRKAGKKVKIVLSHADAHAWAQVELPPGYE